MLGACKEDCFARAKGNGENVTDPEGGSKAYGSEKEASSKESGEKWVGEVGN